MIDDCEYEMGAKCTFCEDYFRSDSSIYEEISIRRYLKETSFIVTVKGSFCSFECDGFEMKELFRQYDEYFSTK